MLAMRLQSPCGADGGRATTASALLYQAAAHDPDRGNHGKHDGEHQREHPCLVQRQRGVHAVERENHRRHREHQRDDGERAHREVEVVVDERAKRVHRLVEDLRVDAAHLDGLPDLDGDVVQQVAVVLVQPHGAPEANAPDRGVQRLERGGEVHERLLEAEHLDEVRIAHGAAELALVLAELPVDGAQVRLVAPRYEQQHLQQQARALRRVDARDAPAGHRVHRRVGLEAHGHDGVLLWQKQHGERMRVVLHDGGVHGLALVLHKRAVHDHERLPGLCVQVHARRLLVVERGRHELRVHVQLLKHPAALLLRGRHHADPAPPHGSVDPARERHLRAVRGNLVRRLVVLDHGASQSQPSDILRQPELQTGYTIGARGRATAKACNWRYKAAGAQRDVI